MSAAASSNTHTDLLNRPARRVANGRYLLASICAWAAIDTVVGATVATSIMADHLSGCSHCITSLLLTYQLTREREPSGLAKPELPSMELVERLEVAARRRASHLLIDKRGAGVELSLRWPASSPNERAASRPSVDSADSSARMRSDEIIRDHIISARIEADASNGRIDGGALASPSTASRHPLDPIRTLSERPINVGLKHLPLIGR